MTVRSARASRKARKGKAARQWDHVYRSARARGKSVTTSYKMASGVVKKRKKK
jgi:hypothetical protein